MTYDNALIIGGGIAGPVAAMALRKVGIEATVYEAYDGTAHGVGSFMSMASNGLDGLRTLDAHESVQAVAFPTPRMVLWSGAGKRLGVVENGSITPDGTASMTMNRAALYAALRTEAAARGIRTEHGKRLVAVEQDEGAVTATFGDGTQARGSVLVGADGLWSTTRTHVDPTARGPRYVGLVGTGGYATGLDVGSAPGTFNMMLGKRAFFGYAVHEDGTVWWFANVPWAGEPGPAELAAWPQRRTLADLFAGDALPAARIIEATEHDLQFLPMHDMAPGATWHRGRAVLAGDAAHATSPSSGQGASLAIEDALELARCLRDIPDPSLAFTAYRHLRHERTKKVYAYARRINQTKAARPVARVFRDAMMPPFLARFARPGSSEWLYGHHVDFERRVAAATVPA